MSKIGHFNSVNQALKALPPDGSKRKEPEEVEPDVEKKGEALSVQQEEVTDGEVGTRQLCDEIESTQEIQQPSGKLQETEEKLRKAEEEVGRLQEENEQLKCLLEENGIPWKSTPGDQYTQAA